MNVVIDQAYYGERGDAYDLRAASDLALARRHTILRRTDRPNTSPGQLTWEPSVVGFPDGEIYVVARIFPDPHAKREGMVWAHALFIDRDAASNLSDFGVLLELLATSPRDETEISSIVLDASQYEPPELPLPGLGAVVAALLTNANGTANATRPVVWLDLMSFPELVRSLWWRLWPALRRQLSFGLAFAPSDVPTGQLLVASPSAFAGRWIDHILIRPGDADPPLSPPVAFLLGHPDGAQLRELRNEIGASLPHLKHVLLLAEYARSLPHIEQGANIDAVRLQCRRLAELAPDPGCGQGPKQRLMEQLAALTAIGDATAVGALRNFPWESFSTWEDAIGQAIASWSIRLLRGSPPQDVGPYALLLQQAFRTNDSRWSTLVRQGIRQALSDWHATAAPVLWTMWLSTTADPLPPPPIVPQRQIVEDDLTRSCPSKLPAPLASALVGWAIDRGLLSVHAAVVAASQSPDAAFRYQLAVDSEPSSIEGLTTLAGRVPPSELVAAALAHDDDRLIQLAARACVGNPDLLQELDARDVRWRRLWLAAINRNIEPLASLPDPAATVETLLDVVLIGEAVDERLLVAVANTVFADLTAYRRRDRVLTVLPTAAVQGFRKSTAAAWFRRFVADPDNTALPEPDLEELVLAPDQIAAWLSSSQAQADRTVLVLCSRVVRVTEAEFSLWLLPRLNSGAGLSEHNSFVLGRLVLGRGWANTARHLADLVLRAHRPDLHSAIAACADLVTVMQRWRLFFRGISSMSSNVDDDWWNALGDVAAHIYPRGPHDGAIWERAGGELKHLTLRGTGREMWATALSALRAGGGGPKISRDRLLQTLRDEFPENQDLAELATRKPWGR